MPCARHSPKFKRCVLHVQDAGHDEGSAYAICTAAGIKADADDPDELTDAEKERIDTTIRSAKAASKQAPLVLDALKLDAVRREATGVFVKPFDGTHKSLDLDGEAVALEDVYTMARLFMEQRRIGGHDDQHDRSSDVGTLVEIFVNDDRIDSPHFPRNAGVATMKYTADEWDLVVSGQRTGFSFDVGVLPEVALVELLVPPSQVRSATKRAAEKQADGKDPAGTPWARYLSDGKFDLDLLLSETSDIPVVPDAEGDGEGKLDFENRELLSVDGDRLVCAAGCDWQDAWRLTLGWEDGRPKVLSHVPVRDAAKGPPTDGGGEEDSVSNPLVPAKDQSAGRWARLQRRWKAKAGDDLEPEQVDVADLRTLQPEVQLGKVLGMQGKPEVLGMPVAVVEDDGELVLVDGNHRVAAAHEDGAKTVLARVVRAAKDRQGTGAGKREEIYFREIGGNTIPFAGSEGEGVPLAGPPAVVATLLAEGEGEGGGANEGAAEGEGNREYKGPRISKKKRNAIYERDGHQCVYCRSKQKDGAMLSLDHVVPHAEGGGDHSSNLVTACLPCNAGRQEFSMGRFARYLRKERGVDRTEHGIRQSVEAATKRPLKNFKERPPKEKQ